MSASPKVLGATLAMTTVAVLGNYLRSQGTSFVDYQDDRPKTFGEIIADAWARWGGFAYFDYARRANENFKYGSGTIGSLAKGVTGPLPADVIDAILYRKGLFTIGASNTPGYGAMGLVSKDAQKAWRTAGRELDKKVEGFIFGEKESQTTTKRRGSFRTGGPAVNVPNAPDRPEERVNKNTGVPYDLEAGPTAQPEKNRSGLSEEGKLLATLERRQKKFPGGPIVPAVIAAITKQAAKGALKGSKASKKLRKNYTDPKYLDTLKPKKSNVDSKFNMSARDTYDLLTDGKITVKQAEDYLKDYGYRKETVKKIIRGFKEIDLKLGDDFITFTQPK